MSCSELVDFTFTWKIEHYSEKINTQVKSPTFIANEFLKKSEWTLSLECDKFLAVFLNLENVESIPDESTRIEYTITIVASETSSNVSKKITTKVFDESLSGSDGYGFDKVVSLKKLLNKRHLYLPQDTLTIQCYMVQKDEISGPELEEDDTTPLQNVNHANTLFKGLYDLYLNNKFCDIKIKTSDRVFSAHKNVVCARSPVFCAMFEADTEEKNSGVINIIDIDSRTLNNMLTFMYSDSVEEMDLDQAAKLYAAADKYCILFLKDKCSASLQSLLSCANVGDVYVLADMHQDVDLKSAVQNYVFVYAKRVFKSPEWKDFMKLKPELSAEIMHSLWIKHLDD